MLGQQSKRFAYLLREALKSNASRDCLIMHDLKPDDLGTHSIRKGAASYVTSRPAGPPIVAVCLRVGWSMGSIQVSFRRRGQLNC